MKRTLALAAVAAVSWFGATAAQAAQFNLMIYETAADLAKRSDTGPAGQGYWGAYQAYGDALKSAGVLRGGGALQPSREARTVSVSAGQTRVQARPAAQSRAQLGGWFTIEVDTLDAALAWAAKAPAATAGGAVEVRPLYPVPGMN